MSQTKILEKAEKAFRKRKFSEVISLLERNIVYFDGNFRVYYLLGVSCLYLSDFGGASTYFSRAERIRMISSDLMIVQGVLCLHHGNIPRAVEYYLNALEYAPNSREAKKALQFIKKNSEKIKNMAYSRKLKKLYPKTGLNPAIPYVVAIFLVLGIGFTLFAKNYKEILGLNGVRADLSAFVLSVDERAHPLETDFSTVNYRYILTSTEVSKLYSEAQTLFQQGKDNAVQVNINRILNSNASTAIKYKAKLLLDYLEEPTFDNFSNTFSYEDLKKDPYLYQDCWIILSGRISNVDNTELFYLCDLLVGYENMKKLDGIVPLQIKQPISINSTQPIKVLGKVSLKDGILMLDVKSVYQPLQENL
jgi:tetratricopeptide (TPR) repeat protein